MSKADRRARKRENKQQGRAEREAALKRQKQRSGMKRGAIVAAVIVAIFAVILYTGRHDKKKATATTTAVSTTTSTPTSTTALPAFTKTKCNDTKPPADTKRPTFTKAPALTIDKTKTYTATMTTSCGSITIALDAKNAPVATNNFVYLAQQHFYDGLTFHRIIPNFVVQGGDPKGDGSGGAGYTVKGEAPKDGYPLGALAAAKGGNEADGTMGSQFYIVTGTDGMALPNQYARFGVVSKGIDVARTLDSFGSTAGTPSRTLYIFKVSISVS